MNPNAAITREREKHTDMPGSELDIKNTPNDWVAIASYYLVQNTRRATMLTPPTADDYKENLVKAGAVILAAIEHIDSMKDKDELS